MNEEDVIKSLKHLKHIKSSNNFRQTLQQTLEQNPLKRATGIPSLKVVGLTLTIAALFVVVGFVYVNQGRTQTGNANLQQPTPEPTQLSQLTFSIQLDSVDSTPVPTPIFDPSDPLGDVWQETILPDVMLAQDQPFSILYPTVLPEGHKLKEIYLISSKHMGEGIRLLYSIPNSIAPIEITQFVDTTEYGLLLDPDTTTLYTVGESDAACYPLDNRVNIFAWSKGNYILEIWSSLPCDELYAIAASVQ